MDTQAVDIHQLFPDISVLDIDEGKMTQRIYRSRQTSDHTAQQKWNEYHPVHQV